jgi:hypothetical protein
MENQQFGLIALAASAHKYHVLIETIAENEQRYEYNSWYMQYVCLFLALDQTDVAIEILQEHVPKESPFRLWLHLWPVLDPLREIPEFMAIEAMS